MATPEFSRLVFAATLAHGGSVVRLEAEPEECAALAQRYGIPGVERVAAEVRLEPLRGGAVRARGWIAARVTQTCIVSLEPVEQSLEVPFSRLFRPGPIEIVEGRALDVAWDPEAEDEEPYVGSSFDLGEAVAEEVALSLDPFPRRPDAALPPPELDEPDPTNPFAVLAQRPH